MAVDLKKRKEAQERWAREHQEQLEATVRFLKTPDGALMLELLGWKFDRKLLGATPEQTAANVGAREVVRYLRGLREREE